MLKNRIIPCLDVNNGRVVKGINFIDLKDAGDPVEQAEYYDKCGADEICFLDITATHENRNTIIDIVNKTAEKCFVPLTVGGGIRSIQNVWLLLLMQRKYQKTSGKYLLMVEERKLAKMQLSSRYKQKKMEQERFY